MLVHLQLQSLNSSKVVTLAEHIYRMTKTYFAFSTAITSCALLGFFSHVIHLYPSKDNAESNLFLIQHCVNMLQYYSTVKNVVQIPRR